MICEGTSAHERFLLQKAQVENLEVVYWGRSSLWVPFPILGTFDVVTVQDPFLRGLVGLNIAWRMGAKLNVQVHTDLSSQSVLRRMIAAFVLRRADSVRVVSKTIESYVTHMGVKVPIHVLPIYIDIERFQKVTHRPHTTFAKHILWVGRFEEEKNPAGAIKVLRAVRNAGIDAGLTLLGSGTLESHLRKESTGLPIEFPGWQDPLSHLETADVVISTSNHESYGASIIEALAAGVPVVAPDVGIAREAGALIVPREEMADAVTKILTSGTRSALTLSLLSKEAWAKAWRSTLV